MKTKYYLLTILILTLNSCVQKEQSTGTNVSVFNKSNQKVELRFSSSLNLKDSTIVISFQNKITFFEATVFGGPVVPYHLLSGYDTCRVVFNDSVYLMHHWYSDTTGNIHFVEKNFSESIEKVSKQHTSFNYEYRITEDDFLNAEPL